MINVLVIIVFKSNEDLIQGISKLDDIVKVSVFQTYRKKDKNKEKQSFLNDLLSQNEGDANPEFDYRRESMLYWGRVFSIKSSNSIYKN